MRAYIILLVYIKYLTHLNLNKILYPVYLYVCVNMKFSSTRSTSETNLASLWNIISEFL